MKNAGNMTKKKTFIPKGKTVFGYVVVASAMSKVILVNPSARPVMKTKEEKITAIETHTKAPSKAYNK